jgi:glucose/arabinose dehydrogenase
VAALASAVDLAVRPGDPALYVVEHAGRVVRVDGADVRTVADLGDRLLDHLPEQGFTGLEFAADGDVAWIHYTTRNGTTTVSEVAVAGDGTFDLDSERPLVQVTDTPAVNHNAGDLLLDADGNLLITLGDGHADSDRFRNGGDPTTLRGSILRVRPTPSADEPYVVPDDNPFADGPIVAPDGRTVAGAPEVFAWGLRNPWKIDLDPVTGSLWIADVGEDDAEEVNAVFPLADHPAGWSVDFGWSRFEGTEPQNGDVASLLGDPVDPVFTYPHDGQVCAISGGVVYRGAAIPDLRSGYVYADFCAGAVWVYDSVAGTARPLLGATSDQPAIGGISAVRRGPDGEIYVLSWSGSIHRLVSSGR